MLLGGCPRLRDKVSCRLPSPHMLCHQALCCHSSPYGPSTSSRRFCRNQGAASQLCLSQGWLIQFPRGAQQMSPPSDTSLLKSKIPSIKGAVGASITVRARSPGYGSRSKMGLEGTALGAAWAADEVGSMVASQLPAGCLDRRSS